MSPDTSMQRLRAWIQKQPTGATGGGTHVGIGLLDKALADERESARDEVLEEAVWALLGPAADCAGLNPDWDAGRKAGAAAIRALKTPPREVLCEHGAGEGVECFVCHPCPDGDKPTADCPRCHGRHGQVEMASEENGLLPKSRRKEHEYGRAKHTIKRCRRTGCTASSRPGYLGEMYRARDVDEWRPVESSCLGT